MEASWRLYYSKEDDEIKRGCSGDFNLKFVRLGTAITQEAVGAGVVAVGGEEVCGRLW
jgi:hypothetical protein